MRIRLGVAVLLLVALAPTRALAELELAWRVDVGDASPHVTRVVSDRFALAGSHRGPLAIGGARVGSSRAAASTLYAVWVGIDGRVQERAVHEVRGGFVTALAATLDERGDVLIGGQYGGAPRVGSIQLPDVSGGGFVLRLRRDGGLESVAFIQGLASPGWMHMSSVGPSDVLLAGHTAGRLQIGATSAAAAGPAGWVARLSTDGAVSRLTLLPGVVLNDAGGFRDGAVAVTGWYAGDVSIEGRSLSGTDGAAAFVGRIAPEGRVEWLHRLGGRSECVELMSELDVVEPDRVRVTAAYCGFPTLAGDTLPNGARRPLVAMVGRDGSVTHARALFRGAPHEDGSWAGVRHSAPVEGGGASWMVGALGSRGLIETLPPPRHGGMDGVLLRVRDGGRVDVVESLGGAGYDELSHVVPFGGGLLVAGVSQRARFVGRVRTDLLGTREVEPASATFSDLSARDRLDMLRRHDFARRFVQLTPEPGDAYVAFTSWGDEGRGHAAVAAGRLTQGGFAPTVAFGHVASNLEQGWGASLGFDPSGDDEADDRRYHRGLTVAARRLDPEEMLRLIAAGSFVWFARVGSERFDSVVRAIEQAASCGSALGAIDHGIGEHAWSESFARLNECFAPIVEAAGLEYPTERASPPQNRLGRLFFQMPEPSEVTSLADYDALFRYEVGPGDEFDGPRDAAGRPHGAGTARFGRGRRIRTPSGQAMLWLEYEGALEHGLFAGTGRLRHRSYDRAGSLSTIAEYEGELEGGLPHGRGLVRVAGTDRVMRDGTFERGGLRDGWETEHWPDGAPRRARQLQNGRTHGRDISLYRGGGIRWIRHCRDGVLHGRSYELSATTGALISEWTYDSGRRERIREIFYDGIVRRSDGGWADVRLPETMTRVSPTLVEYRGYADHDAFARGRLAYIRTTEAGETSVTHAPRRFDYANGDSLTVVGDTAEYRWRDGSVLVGGYTVPRGTVQLQIRHEHGVTHQWYLEQPDFEGPCTFQRADGAVLSGRCRRGFVAGPATFVLPNGEAQAVDVRDGGWSYTVTQIVQVGRAGVLRRIGRELERGADRVVAEIDRFGDRVARTLCEIVGREPGETCHVAGGVGVSSDGSVFMTDGAGNAVEARPVDALIPDVPALSDFEWIDYADGTSPWIDQSFLTGFTGELHLWPGMAPRQGIHQPGEVRTEDAWGDGRLFAPRRRDGETYAHRGADYVTQPGQLIMAPVSGVITRRLRVYSDDAVLSGIELRNEPDTGYRARVLYVEPLPFMPGQRVERGVTPLGHAQDLSSRPRFQRSGRDAITNHVHIELRAPSGMPMRHDGRPFHFDVQSVWLP